MEFAESADGAPPSLQSTYGMLEIGMALALLLTGVAAVQVWNYMRTFGQDAARVRAMVLAVFMIDALHSALLLHTSYYYTIILFGNYEALGDIVWSLNLSILLNGVIALIVQGYYCDRVYRVTGSLPIALGCATLSVARFVFNCIEVSTLFRSGKWTVVKTATFKWQMTTTLVVGAVSDVFIAGFICIGLARLRTGFRTTDRLVDKLVTFTVGSGLLTSIAAIVEAALYLSQDNFAFVVPYSIVAKLFNNSLLAALNEREANRREMASVSIANRSTRSDHIIRTEEIEMHTDTDSRDMKPTPRESKIRVFTTLQTQIDDV